MDRQQFPTMVPEAEGMRLRTLIVLRWMAVTGQVVALIVAIDHFGLQIPVTPAALAVALAVLANIVFVLGFSETRRLSEPEAMLTLLFDISQLAFLLYLTGGINNPFALLMLAPVTISATALRLRTTVFLGAMAILLITLIAVRHEPLHDAQGGILALPGIFRFGFWLAIVIGVVFMGVYSYRVASESRAMSRALLATQMALAREQKLTDLGGVVAAAAHELGTPLATIKLVSSELADELSDRPDLREDVQLIRDQADRCRDILRSMGRAGKEDRQIRAAPVEAVLREAAEPHAARGRSILFALPEGRQPLIRRQPEVIHGLRNLVQNAVDFSSGTVRIAADWDTDRLRIRIEDDGPGYPPQLIGRIGEPFVRQRRADEERNLRPEYEGMGLGLFIAKTLLERTGAGLTFANIPGPEGRASGAMVEVVWPRHRIEASGGALGENAPIES